jgi:hypothetical protein
MQDSSNPIFQAIFNRVKENPNKLLVPSSSEFVDLLLTEPNQVLIMVQNYECKINYSYLYSAIIILLL